MGGGRVHDLLWAVRELRRGEDLRARRRARSLPPELAALLAIPLADLCRDLADRLVASAADVRAIDACIRFYGLGRMPEDVHAIATTVPRASRRAEHLHHRRVEQLVSQAATVLAADLARSPLDLAHDPEQAASPAPFEAACPCLPRRALLWAWADVPDSDHQSATALLLFEQEARLRPPVIASLHRETRRRLKRRAQAILRVAAQRCRSQCAVSPRTPHRLDPAADLLLGPRQLALVDTRSGVLDPILRPLHDHPAVDIDRLLAAASYAHEVVQAGSPDAPAVLGVVRHAIARSQGSVPAPLTTKVLATAVVLARSRDDPAGFPAGWEALRIARQHLASARDGDGTRQVVANTLRVLQELAELHDRTGSSGPALRTLEEAYALLAERGDPEADDEPNGWLQQLLFSQGIIQRRAARLAERRARDLLVAHAAAARSAELVRREGHLPLEWGLSAQAVQAEIAVDLVEAAVLGDDARAAAYATAHARAVIAGSAAGWRRHGRPRLAVGLSARLTTLRAACRLALLCGEVDSYLAQRTSLAAAAGSWMLPCDLEALDALEADAERLGVPRLGLSGRGLDSHRRIGQRSRAVPERREIER